MVKAGYQGLKWDPFGDAYMKLDKKEFRASFECIEAVRDTVGNDVEIMIEAHGRFNVPTAIRIGKALQEFDILWFEEPLPPDSKDALLEVKKRVGVPIAAGERLYSRWEYNDFLKMGCADYIQPDVSHVGGILELKKIAAMAEASHIPVCPHNPSGPISNAATLQLAANIPNFYLLETMSSDVPYRQDICNENIDFDSGIIHLPDAPGLGIEINEEEIEKYPYKPINLRHYSNTLTDIRPDDAEQTFNRQSVRVGGGD